MMMRNAFALWSFALVLGVGFTNPSVAATPASPYVLVLAKGVCPYVIVLADDASLSEKYAASELSGALLHAAGVKIPILAENETRSAVPPRFLIGPGKKANELISQKGPVDWKALGDEGFVLRTILAKNGPPDVVMAGGRLRGSMYGVFTFLDHMGFRWYTNRVTRFPAANLFNIPALDEKVIPVFMSREPSITEAHDNDWAAHNRVNMGFVHSIDAARGGSAGVLGVHTFNALIPPSLFKEHPEYFPLIGGKRVTGYVQRCLASQGIVEVAAANMIKWMSENPSGVIFDLSQNDADNLCECPECTRITNEEGSPSGPYLAFVNRVAEIVEKTYPDRYVSTLSYTFTEKPPRTIKPRRNVIIRLCPISNCAAHPFPVCPDSACVKFTKNLEGWSKLTDRISIWHYATDFSNFLMPFPDFKEFTADIRNYRDKGVKGIFFESSEGSPGGSDADLRAWVMARLLWNPDDNADRLVSEWIRGVYGPAYGPMRAYFDLIHARVAPLNRHLYVFDAPTKKFWPDAMVASMDSLFTRALALAANDTTALYYVRKNHLGVTFLKTILNCGRLKVINNNYQPSGNKASLDDCNRLISEIREFGITNIGGGGMDCDAFTMLRQRFESHPVVSIENSDLKVEAVPSLGGRLVSIIVKKTGKNILSDSDPTNNSYPAAGGYEEMTAMGWGCTGFANDYKTEVQGRTMTLTAKASGELVFKRVISLPESGMQVRFASSITNAADQIRTFQLVCRAEFQASRGKPVIQTMSADGSLRTPIPTEVKPSIWPYQLESYRYDGPNKPNGAWRLENRAAGWSVTDRFDPDAITLFNVITGVGVDVGDIFEIHSPEKEVNPGGSISIEHTLEIAR